MMISIVEQGIAVILILIGISMYIYWLLFYILLNKKLTNGIKTIEKDVGQVIFHIIAELLAGTLSIFAGLLLLTNNSLAYPITYAVLGMQIYIGIRTLSWSVLNNKKLIPNLVLVTLISIISFVYLIL